jgi:hypothetical protein
MFLQISAGIGLVIEEVDSSRHLLRFGLGPDFPDQPRLRGDIFCQWAHRPAHLFSKRPDVGEINLYKKIHVTLFV